MHKLVIGFSLFFSIFLTTCNRNSTGIEDDTDCNRNSTGIEEDTVPIMFAKTFGGSDDDVGLSVQQTTDNGFIIAAAKTGLEGGMIVWLIKTDSGGDEEWNQTLGSGLGVCYSVRQTSNGGFILVGIALSSGNGSHDVWLIKTDSKGTEEWNRTFGGSGSDVGYSVQQTNDGGFILTGMTGSYGNGSTDVWLIKTDAEGIEEWNQTFGGGDRERGYSVQQTSDNGFVIAGTTWSFGNGNGDIWLIKTDAEGVEEWNQTFGGREAEEAKSIQQTTDGGFIIAGSTASCGNGDEDVWLIKTDPWGNEEWNRTFGGSVLDNASSVQQTSDGGFIIAGTTWSFGNGGGDFWLIKTNAEGAEEWNQTFGGGGDEDAYSVQQTSDGGFIITGSTRSFGNGRIDVWLVKTYPDGNTILQKTKYMQR